MDELAGQAEESGDDQWRLSKVCQDQEERRYLVSRSKGIYEIVFEGIYSAVDRE